MAKICTSFLIAAASALALSACGGEIRFSEAESYFVKNTVQTVPDLITTAEQRDSVFGMATTMSSTPTSVDFDTEAIVPVALPETDVVTEVSIASIRVEDDTLVVSCEVKRGEKVSYTTRPLALAVVKKTDINGVKAVKVVGAE